MTDINGNPQNNTLTGGPDADTITGQAGDDTLYGGGGDDQLYGGNDNDLLVGGTGNDLYYGGAGNDTASFAGAAGAVFADLATSSNLSGIENLTGSSFADVLHGDAGDNIINGGADSSGGSTLYGGSAGNDTVSYADVALALVIHMDYGQTKGFTTHTDTIEGFANAIGGSGDDTIVGDGIRGNAHIYENVLDGGAGADKMRGLLGSDTYIVDNVGDKVSEKSGEGFHDKVLTSLDTYALTREVEDLVYTGTGNFTGTGGQYVNSITGGAGDDILDGKAGADSLYGGAGNDTYLVDNVGDLVFESAGGGHDTVVASKSYTLAAGVSVEVMQAARTTAVGLTGNELGQELDGNSGANVLDGAGGDDVIYGGAGKDTLIGGAGNDTLYGGLGLDTFVFGSITDVGADVIGDFSHAEKDRINLSAIDANTGTGGDDAFAFIGTAAFGHVAGQLRYEVIGSDVIVSGDVNGDGAADFSLTVLGVSSLAAADFTP